LPGTGHFPANIATIYSYPENAALEKTVWRWGQSGPNSSPAAFPCEQGNLQVIPPFLPLSQ
jgi:hypothetical protein